MDVKHSVECMLGHQKHEGDGQGRAVSSSAAAARSSVDVAVSAASEAVHRSRPSLGRPAHRLPRQFAQLLGRKRRQASPDRPTRTIALPPFCAHLWASSAGRARPGACSACFKEPESGLVCSESLFWRISAIFGGFKEKSN